MKRQLSPAPVRKATRDQLDALKLWVLAASECRGIAKLVERGLGEARQSNSAIQGLGTKRRRCFPS